MEPIPRPAPDSETKLDSGSRCEISRELISQYRTLFKGISQVSWCLTTALAVEKKQQSSLAGNFQ